MSSAFDLDSHTAFDLDDPNGHVILSLLGVKIKVHFQLSDII